MFTLRPGTLLRGESSGTASGALSFTMLAALLAALAIAVSACSGDEPEPAPTPTQEAVAEATPEPPPPSFIGDVEAIWAEDFERYSAGTFPREGGWQRWKSRTQNAISSQSSAGGTKAYELGKSSQTAKKIPVGLQQVSYTAKFMVTAIDETSPSPSIMIGLGWKMVDGNVPHASACGVWVNGRLTCGGMDLGLAEAEKWYELHVVADLASGSAQYWLDGTDYGVSPLVTSFGVPLDNVSHLLALSGPREVEAYIDDVAVFRGEVGPLSSSQP